MGTVALRILIADLILFAIGTLMTFTLDGTDKAVARVTGHYPLRVEIFIILVRLLTIACILCFIISIFE